MSLTKSRIRFICIAFILMLPLFIAAQEYDWAAIDEEAFEKTQPTEKIMDIIGIKAGMFVAEVGAGGGRVAVRVARRVGPGGRVYANDITDSAIAYMRQRIQRDNIQNMEVVKGTLTDPLLPKGKLDAVYLTFTYRHLDKPVERIFLPGQQFAGQCNFQSFAHRTYCRSSAAAARSRKKPWRFLLRGRQVGVRGE